MNGTHTSSRVHEEQVKTDFPDISLPINMFISLVPHNFRALNKYCFYDKAFETKLL